MTTSNAYTIIAYRPEGADYCRGCLMDSSSSDHAIRYCETEQEAAEAIAGYRFESNHSGREYASWETTLLIDGRNYVETDEYPDAFDRVEAQAQQHLQRLEQEHREEEQRQKDAEARRKQEKKRQDEIAAEETDRREYERLTRKYA